MSGADFNWLFLYLGLVYMMGGAKEVVHLSV